MSMADKSCSYFLDVLASKAPVPGGGGAAAMGGAIGMALANMVGNLTVGKKKYADVEDEVKNLLAKGSKIIDELKTLVDRDAEVFEPLSKAYGLPKDTPEQAAHKAEVMEKRSIEACAVPMDIMRKAYAGIKVHQRMGQIGTKLAISDVGCGVTFLKAALISGRLNVLINLGAIKDQQFIDSTREEMNKLLEEGCRIADETLALVTEKLS
ncbi:MAG: cyclodeaminase/cyclohydrolase family protein [Bacillota bacterium]